MELTCRRINYLKSISLAVLLLLGYKYKKTIWKLYGLLQNSFSQKKTGNLDSVEPRVIYERGTQTDGIQETQVVTVKPQSLLNGTHTFRIAYIETIEWLSITVKSNGPINIINVEGGVGQNFVIAKVQRPSNHSVEMVVETIRHLNDNEKFHRYVLLQQGDLVGKAEPDEIHRLFPKERILLDRSFQTDITGIVVGAISKDKLAYTSITKGGIGQKNIILSIYSGDNVTEICLKITTKIKTA